MYKLKIKESNGQIGVIYFATGLTISTGNGRTYVRDQIGTTFQTDESIESIEARIDALLAAVV